MRNIKTIRGWGSRCLVKITGRSYSEECKDPAVDLVGLIEKTRMKYVGHVLRRETEYLVRQVIIIKIRDELRDGRSKSSILKDVPEFNSVEEIIEMAQDKNEWQLEANSLQRKSKYNFNNELMTIVVEPNNSIRLNTTTVTHRYNLRSRNCSK